MKKQIGIIGLGYLGLRLANRLNQTDQYKLIGTTKSSKPDINFEHFHLDLEQDLPNHHFWQSDVVVLSFPPSKLLDYPGVINKICEASKQVIMISSTSAYAADQGEVNENDKPIGKDSIVKAEEFVIKDSTINTVLRLGGIVGENRQPWNYVSGKTYTNDEYLHLVHVDNCLDAIEWIIKNPSPFQIYNIVNNQRVLKSDFYSQKCQEPPFYGPLLLAAKRISNLRSIEVMGIEYKDL